MAKKSMQARASRNAALVKRGVITGKREQLKEIMKAPVTVRTPEEKMDAMLALQKRPINESPTRLRSRCNHCGRVRGYLRRFGMCRLCVRKFFVLGYFPGVVKSSW